MWGLNTYLYAPKDDYKHRMYWRDLYSEEEASESQLFTTLQSLLTLSSQDTNVPLTRRSLVGEHQDVSFFTITPNGGCKLGNNKLKH